MNCKHGVLQLIDRIIEIIQIIPEPHYSKPLEVFNGSTLGKHFRHIFDFFGCVVDQCDMCQLDYAQRQRDPRLEESGHYAIDRFMVLKEKLSQVAESQQMTVFADFELEEGQRPIVQTTVGRELMYGYDHAVHHLAIVKIGLKSLDMTLPIDEKMGVAASTIKHQYELTHGH